MAYDIGPRITIKGEKEFNSQIKSINESLKVYGSELKAVSSEFENNAKSQDALIAKNKILEKQYDTQKQKLNLYEEQLKKRTKLLNEQEQELSKLTQEYGENSKEVLKAQNAYRATESNISKLKTSINETTAFTNKLSNEINQNNRYLTEMQSGTRDAATGLKKLGDEANDAQKDIADVGDTVKGAFATTELADAAGNLADNMKAVVEESKEHLKIMGALETSSERAGYSAEQTAETYKLLYGVLNDDQTAATTTANLQALGLEQEDLIRITNGAIGAWARYGDSIPIDGLAESINETVKVGTVTGTFADVLNWAGTSEDEFNKKLEKANTTSERANIVLQELASQGLIESANAFRENNSALVESNEVQAEYQNSLSELGENLMPIITDITEAITFLIDGFNNLPGPVQTIITVIAGFIAVLAMLSPVLFSISTLMSTLGITAAVANIGMLPIIGTIFGIIAAVTAVILIFQNWDNIVKWFSKNFEAFKKWIGETVNSIGEWFGNMGSKIGGAFSDLWKTISNFFSGLFESAVEWGSDMIDGFVKGIKKAVGKVTDAVKGVADTITSWLHFSRPDVGPLREYEKWMPDMMDGLSRGIKNNRWKVEDEIAILAENMRLNPDVQQTAYTRYEGSTIINLITNLDGKVIAKSTEKIYGNRQRSRQLSRGY